MINETDFISLLPNPVLDIFTLEVVRERQLPATLKLVNSQHQLVSEYEITEHETIIDTLLTFPQEFILQF